MRKKSFLLTRDFSFESAHFLPFVPKEHKCRRLHGHSFRISVALSGPVDPNNGMVIDYSEIKKTVSPIIDSLDHRLLNDIEGLENPTSENIAIYLSERIHFNKPVKLDYIRVYETCNTSCTLNLTNMTA